MKIYDWLFRHSQQQPSSGRGQRIAESLGIAILLVTAGVAVAQTPADQVSAPGANMSVPSGYSVHSSVDVGGRINSLAGSGSMYDTLVNLQSGPRMLGQTFEMRALEGNKRPLFDNLSAFSTGWGGDPYSFTKLDAAKGKFYEFSSTFRRDRQYFDYDLLGNPNIPSGQTIPIGTTGATYAWPQVQDSPFLFNTVRRMTDTNLTLMPMATVTYRFGYSQSIMQGPTVSPSGYQIAGGYSFLLREYQRNSTDDFMGAMDWKPVQGTKLTFEEQIDHYKGNSYFTGLPSTFTVQESDGTPVAFLASYQGPGEYAGSSCNAAGLAGAPILTASTNSNSAPIINAACDVMSSYRRTQPTRVLFPTEIFRLQSTSIKNLSMNGDVRYTNVNMNLPSYNDDFQGFVWVAGKAATGTTPAVAPAPYNSIAFAAAAHAKREVLAADYGVVWQATKKIALEEQVNYSDVQQPGSVTMAPGAEAVQATTTAPNFGTINYNGAMTTPAAAPSLEGTITGLSSGYFGQKFEVSDSTISWDATPRSTFALTYRYKMHLIGEGESAVAGGPLAHNAPLYANAATDGTVTIHENGGVFNAALRPTSNWNINGTAEILYDDNAFTPMGPRQTRHYRVHTIYRANTWATLSGAFNDMEQHNNTNENALIFTPATPTKAAIPSGYVGPLDHVNYTRAVALNADLFPSEHYGVNLNYAYTDVYMADNVCVDGAATTLPNGTIAPGVATSTGSLCAPVSAGHGGNTVLAGPFKDFEDAPVQSGSGSVVLSPNPKLKSNIGYRINSSNGTRFFSDTGDVNGSLVSTYQTPFANVAWTVHPGLIWKAEYDYYGYGEGGPSGAAYCNTDATIAIGAAGIPTANVVPCNTVVNTALSGPSYGLTAPRNFHSSNVVLGIHYEF